MSLPASQLTGIGLLVTTATTVYRRVFAAHPDQGRELWLSVERLKDVSLPGARDAAELPAREVETRARLSEALRVEGANGAAP